MEDLFSAQQPSAIIPPATDFTTTTPPTSSPVAPNSPLPMMTPAEPLGVELTPQTSFDASPLRDWEKKHSQELVEKSKDESERRGKLLAQARQDLDEFNAERQKKSESKQKQNAEEETSFRENQQRVLAEGDTWAQAARISDFTKKPGEKDVTRMRQMLTVLKH